MFGKKGTYGYIKRGRVRLAFITAGLLALVLLVYFGAQWYFKTNKNIFTILAALTCIGVGKFAVDLIMFKCVCALTEDDKCDVKAGEMHIRTMLENDGYKGYTVKIFRNPDKYIERLDELNSVEDGKEKKSTRGAMDVLESISL